MANTRFKTENGLVVSGGNSVVGELYTTANATVGGDLLLVMGDFVVQGNYVLTGTTVYDTDILPYAQTGRSIGNSTHRFDALLRNLTLSGNVNPGSNATYFGSDLGRMSFYANTIDISSSFNIGTGLTANGSLVNVNAINVRNRTNTDTLFATSTVNVGSNVQLTTSQFQIAGNSTTVPTTTITTGGVVVGNATVVGSPSISISNTQGSLTLNTASISIGNATVTWVSANQTLAVFPSINISDTANVVTVNVSNTINYGTSTVNTVVNSTSVILRSTGTTTSVNTSVVNSTALYLLSNVKIGSITYSTGQFDNTTNTFFANDNLLAIGNTTVNSNITGSGLTVVGNTTNRPTISVSSSGLTAGNSSITGSPQVEVSNTSGNVIVRSTGVFVGGNATSLPAVNVTSSGFLAGNNTTTGSPVLSIANTISTSNISPTSIYVGNGSGNVTLSAVGVVINGNLTVTGTTTYVNTTVLAVSDNIITLNADLGSGAAPTENAGVEINRGSSTNSVLRWSETSYAWEVSNSITSGAYYKLITNNDIIDPSKIPSNISVTNINVGSNVAINTSAFFVGNATVNTVANSTTVTTANVFATNVYATSVNATASVVVGANLLVNTSAVFVGNSTINTLANSTTVTTANVFATNVYATSVNATANVVVGANVSVNTTTVFVGNSLVNTTHTSTLLQVSDTTSTANVSSSTIFVGNSTVNSIITGANATFRSGNSTVNTIAFANSTAITTANIFAVNVYAASVNATANVVVGANVFVNTSTVFVGNSSVNATHAATLVQISDTTSTANVSSSTIFVGNSTVNSIITGANATFRSGNSTVNTIAFANSTAITTANIFAVNVYATSINATANIFVGANVLVNTSAVFVGNSTTNTIHTSTLMQVADTTSTANVSSSTIFVGNSTVNSIITGANATFRSGNSTVNTIAFANSTAVTVSNVFATNVYATSVNATANVVVGANVLVNTSTVFVGNSTVNTVHTTNALQLSNSTVNTNIGIGSAAFGNSTVATAIFPTSVGISGGNSTVNAAILTNVDINNGWGVIELGGTNGAYVDFKTPYTDDFDSRLLSNSSGLYIIGGSGTNSANTIFINNANTNFDSGVLFVDQVNNRVGINNTSPGVALRVTGAIDVSGTANIQSNAIFNTGAAFGSAAYETYQTNLDFGADAAGTWRKLVSVSLAGGGATYSTAGFIINIINPSTNHATQQSVDQPIHQTYYVSCNRTNDTVIDTPDQCYVRGPGNLIRAVKISTGNYEIQVQNDAQYREYNIQVQMYVQNINRNCATYFDGSSAGSVGIATYEASLSTTATHYFQRLNVGNSTVNTVANNVSIKLSNSTVNTGIAIPTSVQYSGTNYFLHANGQWVQSPVTNPGGSDTQVQFNDGGVFGGSAGFTFNKTTNTVFVANALSVNGEFVVNSTYITTNGNYFTLSGSSLAQTYVNISGGTLTPTVQLVGNASPDAALGFALYNSSSSQKNYLSFLKSSSNSIGTNATLNSGDDIAVMTFVGVDAQATPAKKVAAAIRVEVDGAPTTNGVGGKITFATTNTGPGISDTITTDRLSIAANGLVNVASGLLGVGSTLSVNSTAVYATSVNAAANVITTNVHATMVNATSNVVTANVFATNVYASSVNTTANVITVNVHATMVNAAANVVTANVFATNVYASSVNTTANVITVNVHATMVNATSNVVTGNVFATSVNAAANVRTVNVHATMVNAAANVVTANVFATNVYATSVNVTANVVVGANVLVNTSTVFVGNSTVNATVQSNSINFRVKTGQVSYVGASMNEFAITIANNTTYNGSPNDPDIYTVLTGRSLSIGNSAAGRMVTLKGDTLSPAAATDPGLYIDDNTYGALYTFKDIAVTAPTSAIRANTTQISISNATTNSFMKVGNAYFAGNVYVVGNLSVTGNTNIITTEATVLNDTTERTIFSGNSTSVYPSTWRAVGSSFTPSPPSSSRWIDVQVQFDVMLKTLRSGAATANDIGQGMSTAQWRILKGGTAIYTSEFISLTTTGQFGTFSRVFRDLTPNSQSYSIEWYWRLAQNNPEFEQGTITVKNSNNQISGSGTRFEMISSAAQIQISGTWYNVSQPVDYNTLLLETNYPGANASGLALAVRDPYEYLVFTQRRAQWYATAYT